MSPYWKKAPSTKKTFPKPVPTEQYEQPIGPTRPSVVDRIKEKVSAVSNSAVATRIKDRSREIAAENNRPAPRGRRASIPSNAGITDPGMGRGFMQTDPFGMGSMGDPFRQRSAPRQPQGRVLYDAQGNEVVIKPKKSKRRKARVSGDDGRFDPPTGIPNHMKWMFGQ